MKDRLEIQTYDAERKIAKPEGLQDLIDAEVRKYPDARAFARPSGTEDTVPIYRKILVKLATGERFQSWGISGKY